MEAALRSIGLDFGPGGDRGGRRAAGCRPGAGRTDANANFDFNTNRDGHGHADSVAYLDAYGYADLTTYVDSVAYLDVYGYTCAGLAYVNVRVGLANADAYTVTYAHCDPALADRHSNADAHLVGYAVLR